MLNVLNHIFRPIIPSHWQTQKNFFFNFQRSVRGGYYYTAPSYIIRDVFVLLTFAKVEVILWLALLHVLHIY